MIDFLELVLYGAAGLSVLYMATLTVSSAWHTVKHAHQKKLVRELSQPATKEFDQHG